MKVMQHPEELAWFVALLRAVKVGSYLEIGSKHGGSLWSIGKSLPSGSKIVSVDLGGNQSLAQCVRDLRQKGYAASLLVGDSQERTLVEQVGRMGPFDACLIDGDHTLQGVTTDWTNYAPMVTKIVAFHDINWKRPADWTGYHRIEVPEFWAGIKDAYRHQECKLDPTGRDNGIGVLWLS